MEAELPPEYDKVAWCAPSCRNAAPFLSLVDSRRLSTSC
jgi:hypothetical protein